MPVARAAAAAAAAPGPASRGVLPLDVGSWVHTTAPQLFRAAVAVVSSNAEAAVPLGVPTLLAFFEPHVCCRRHQHSTSNGSSNSRQLGTGVAVNGGREGSGDEGERVARQEQRHQGQEDAGGGGEETVRWWEGEMQAAAAAGAAGAEEAGVPGDGLMSRLALESLGLLVEGLAGHQQEQLPAAVLAHLCDSLLRMLRRCLPESFGRAGRVGHDGGGGEPQEDPADEDNGARHGAARLLFGDDSGGGGGGGDTKVDSLSGTGRDAVVVGDDASSGGGGDLGPSGRGGGGGQEKQEAFLYPTEETGDGEARPAGSDSLTLSADGEGHDEPTSGSGGGDGRSDGVEFDGPRAAALLAAALRLQRLLYGLARLHLGGLGEGQARTLLGGLSEGVRYARDFQAQHALRTSLFAAGWVFVLNQSVFV